MHPANGEWATTTEHMRAYWDEKARENAMWFIHSQLEYRHPNAEDFWQSGESVLAGTIDAFGISIGPDDRILDVGCGIGRLTRALAARAGSVVGIDVAAEMVAHARTLLGDRPNVEVTVGNGRDLHDFPDGSFDGVFSFVVFQHIPDPAVTYGYVREIGRVLRPGGWTLFQVSQRPEMHDARTWAPIQRSLRWRVGLALGAKPRGTDAPQWLGSAVSPTELATALAEGGLDVVRVTGEGTQFCLVHAQRRPRAATTDRPGRRG